VSILLDHFDCHKMTVVWLSNISAVEVCTSQNNLRTTKWMWPSVVSSPGGAKPRENTPNCDFGGFSHGDLSPRQAKIRQLVVEHATHGMWRTFVWRGEKSPCENTKKSSFGWVSRGAFSLFDPENTLIRHGTNQPL